MLIAERCWYSPNTGTVWTSRKYRDGNFRKLKELKIPTYGGFCTVRSPIKPKVQFVHNLAWTAINGAIPDGKIIEQINGVKTDNRLINLRVVSYRGGGNLPKDAVLISNGVWYSPEAGTVWSTRGRNKRHNTLRVIYGSRSDKVGGRKAYRALWNPEKRTREAVHRVVWEAINGPIPEGLVIDHLNGVVTDNRLCNLRVVTNVENIRKQKVRATNTSGAPGVTRRSGKYRVQIRVNSKIERLGLFTNRDEAYAAYRTRKIEIHGLFSVANIPVSVPRQ